VNRVSWCFLSVVSSKDVVRSIPMRGGDSGWWMADDRGREGTGWDGKEDLRVGN
jgi:hypothetical protein